MGMAIQSPRINSSSVKYQMLPKQATNKNCCPLLANLCGLQWARPRIPTVATDTGATPLGRTGSLKHDNSGCLPHAITCGCCLFTFLQSIWMNQSFCRSAAATADGHWSKARNMACESSAKNLAASSSVANALCLCKAVLKTLQLQSFEVSDVLGSKGCRKREDHPIGRQRRIA